ncbi:MAG: DUF4339 domain-containing protein [Kiritimatiellae bacterium]|nr:DUF4339 domain-containing protein [Kiritimatiellia bacterium]
MSWYLKKKKDAAVYGPVTPEELRHWAMEGRIAPDDTVSQEQKTWIVAPNLPELAMNWMVETDDGAEFGPLNVLALREPLRKGTITPSSTIKHKESGDTRFVGEALLEALLELDAAAEKSTVAPVQRTPDETRAGAPAAPVQRTPAETRAEEPAAPAAPAQKRDPSWTETARRKDQFQREATKWKQLYEEERANAHKMEETLNERIRELRQEQLAARTQIEQAAHRAAQTEKNYNLLKETIEKYDAADPDDVARMAAAHVAALMESYSKLSEGYDALLKQLAEKSADLDALLESRAQSEKEAQARLAGMQEILRREQEEADKARHRVAEMEESHQQLLQSYRELNDRFIRTRHQQAGQALTKTPQQGAGAAGQRR